MFTAMSRIAPILFFAWLACPPISGRSYVRVEKSDEIMGATFSVVLHGTDRAQLDAAADAALDEAHRLDRMLSNYHPDTEWSRVNRLAADRPVVVSEELFALLSECVKYSEQSEGAFDITVAPLVRAWGFFKGEGTMPRAGAVAAARRQVGYRHVRLDAAARTVRFDRPGVELDPGGIGKGYAVDRMVALLKQRGITAALVSASGSSIYGLGSPTDDARGWHIPIRAPRNPDAAAGEVFLRDMSISTSGSYEKFFWAEGRTYAHIIDPRTGYPAQGTASVSVVARRALDSEAWTKPYFINGRQWTASHKHEDMRVFFCLDTPQPTCEWVGS
jgi:thiamine biosynthesis lipoprotein